VHVATEYLLYTAKIKITHVPYKGTGPALNDTIGGSVQMILGSVATALQHVKSGRLRALACLSQPLGTHEAMPSLDLIARVSDSATVGTWGRCVRLGVVTARALKRPDLTCCSAVATLPRII